MKKQTHLLLGWARESKFILANFYFWVNYSFKDIVHSEMKILSILLMQFQTYMTFLWDFVEEHKERHFEEYAGHYSIYCYKKIENDPPP